MKRRRDVAAGPKRTGAETWADIVALITKADSIDKGQLEAAASVMATLLTEAHYADHALTLKGQGDRLVVYCAYGADALTLDDPDPLRWNPTGGEWTLFVPCAEEDFDWAKATLAQRAPRIRLHRLDETPAELKEATAEAVANFEIDWEAAR